MRIHRKDKLNKPVVVRAIVAALLAALFALPMTSCNDPPQQVVVDGQVGAYVDYRDKVCNPFGGNMGGSGYGLVGTMKVLRDEQPRYTSVVDYQSQGELVTANLFFTELNVPTRPFDRGFSTTEGTTLLNQHGTTLYEYFSLSLETVLTLPGGAVPGLYQLAVLSDDGSIISVDEGQGFQTLIDDDGTHPTRMGCATRPVDLSQPLRMKVEYFQGPRYHIAMILMARPWTGSASDVACGQSGNSKFFDSTQDPPAPTATFTALATRGWQALPPTAYRLPAFVQSNPCYHEPLNTQITRVLPGNTPTNQSDIVFEFASNDSQATFFCSLDGAVATSCTSPVSYSGLSESAHEFKVFAEDAAGTRDALGASWLWAIDQTPPIFTEIQAIPGSTSLVLNWETNEPTTGFVDWGVGIDLSNTTYESGAPSTSHSVTIDGLTALTVYSMRPGGQDLAGNSIPLAARPVLRSRTTP